MNFCKGIKNLNRPSISRLRIFFAIIFVSNFRTLVFWFSSEKCVSTHQNDSYNCSCFYRVRRVAYILSMFMLDSTGFYPFQLNLDSDDIQIFQLHKLVVDAIKTFFILRWACLNLKEYLLLRLESKILFQKKNELSSSLVQEWLII